MKWIGILSVSCSLLLVGCSSTATSWDSQLEEQIFGHQFSMDLMTPIYRMAPGQCMAPPPSGPRMSEAEPGTAHARKLYHLYASDGDAYSRASRGEIPNPVGLVLVKETHKIRYLERHEQPEVRKYQESRNEKRFVPWGVTDLFLMYKVGDESTPGTDRGWIYGGATAEGVVYRSGLIESCMECHKDAPHDRLFGLAPAEQIYEIWE
jgi:hypothetical protein